MTSKVAQAADTIGPLTKAGAGISVGGGVWAWIGDNSSEIGALCAMAGFSCALIGMLYNIVMDQRDRRRRRSYYRGDDAQ